MFCFQCLNVLVYRLFKKQLRLKFFTKQSIIGFKINRAGRQRQPDFHVIWWGV
jgi:hypothetical protein